MHLIGRDDHRFIFFVFHRGTNWEARLTIEDGESWWKWTSDKHFHTGYNPAFWCHHEDVLRGGWDFIHKRIWEAFIG
jgi:hypothetical protein